ncbi:MAG: hypothetical protein WCI42_04290 [Verrucomicrobiota bacterium]
MAGYTKGWWVFWSLVFPGVLALFIPIIIFYARVRPAVREAERLARSPRPDTSLGKRAMCSNGHAIDGYFAPCPVCGLCRTDSLDDLRTDHPEAPESQVTLTETTDLPMPPPKGSTHSSSTTKFTVAIAILSLLLIATTSYSAVAMSQMRSEIQSLSLQVGAQNSSTPIAQLKGEVNSLASQLQDAQSSIDDENSTVADLASCVNDFKNAFIEYSYGRSSSIYDC